MFYCCVFKFFKDKVTINYEELSPIDAFRLIHSITPNACLFTLGDYTIQASETLNELTKNLEHWKIPQTQNSIYFFISNWLKDKNPPPRCQALLNNGALCLEEASSKSNTPYCDILHRCKVKSCKNERINVEGLCADHCCLYQSSEPNKKPCIFERFNGADFCVKHLCIGCLLSKSTPVKQRNPIACLDHKCIQRNCNSVQVYPHRFCIDHICLECASIGKKDENPVQKTSGSFICEYHKCSVFNGEMKRFNDNLKFCSYHICRKCKIQINGADLKCADSQLCAEHRCSFSDICKKEKLDSSNYCLDHSCKECISLKCARINPATENPPRNSCKSHPLCAFVTTKGKLCKNMSEKFSLYCAEHKERNNQPKIDQQKYQPCSGITTKNLNCKSQQAFFKINNKWYCNDHRNQAGNLAIDVDTDDSSDEDNDDEKENNEQFVDLKPVLVHHNLKLFEKICCNGVLSKGKRCGVHSFCQKNQLIWYCPIHDINNEKIAENKAASTDLKELLKIGSKPPMIPEKINQTKTTDKIETNTKMESSVYNSGLKSENDCK
jgi:hypothetical protein